MIDYILNKYKKAKKDNCKNNLDIHKKKSVIYCAAIIIVEIILSLFVIYNKRYLISFISVIPLFITLIIICCNGRKKFYNNLDKYENIHKNNLYILKDILKQYSIDSIEKIDVLIGLYQKEVDKINANEERCYKSIPYIFSAVGGILCTILLYKEYFEIDANGFLDITTLIIYIGCAAAGFMYFLGKNSPTRDRYEAIIKDLESLRLLQYK